MQKTLRRSVSQLIGPWQKKMFWLMWVTYWNYKERGVESVIMQRAAGTGS